MSNTAAKQNKTIIGGIRAIMHGWNNPDVDSAGKNLAGAREQENQAAEAYDLASEHTGEVVTELKTAKSNARKEVASGVGEVAEGTFTAPLRAIRVATTKMIERPLLVGLPVVLTVAFGAAQYNDVNFPDVSMPNMSFDMVNLSDTSVSTAPLSTLQTSQHCTNDNSGLRSQLGGFNSLLNAQAVVDKSTAKAPTGTFKIVCGEQGQPDYLVQTNVHCQNAILMGIAEQGSQCTTLKPQQLAQK